VAIFFEAAAAGRFLWSTMPDDELFAQAKAGTLRQNLVAEARPLLPKPNPVCSLWV
jgi:Protein of unknown function (DUF1592)